jgi:hypothetical protein
LKQAVISITCNNANYYRNRQKSLAEIQNGNRKASVNTTTERHRENSKRRRKKESIYQTT